MFKVRTWTNIFMGTLKTTVKFLLLNALNVRNYFMYTENDCENENWWWLLDI